MACTLVGAFHHFSDQYKCPRAGPCLAARARQGSAEAQAGDTCGPAGSALLAGLEREVAGRPSKGAGPRGRTVPNGPRGPRTARARAGGRTPRTSGGAALEGEGPAGQSRERAGGRVGRSGPARVSRGHAGHGVFAPRGLSLTCIAARFPARRLRPPSPWSHPGSFHGRKGGSVQGHLLPLITSFRAQLQQIVINPHQLGITGGRPIDVTKLLIYPILEEKCTFIVSKFNNSAKR